MIGADTPRGIDWHKQSERRKECSMTRPSRLTRLREALSQVVCVLIANGDADEMLSSWAHRNGSNLEPWINWLFRDPTHCQASFEWERSHYNVDRFVGSHREQA
jgi:hypothetical protein